MVIELLLMILGLVSTILGILTSCFNLFKAYIDWKEDEKRKASTPKE